MTEVPYANVVSPKPAQNIANVDYISTFSAPFATVLPEGMNAFYATESSTNVNQVTMKAFSGTVPANEGLVVTAKDNTAVIFVPATTEPELL